MGKRVLYSRPGKLAYRGNTTYRVLEVLNKVESLEA